MQPLLELDHLVIGTLDLESTAKQLELEWGIQFSGGGQHLGYGTHNRVVNIDAVADLDCDGEPNQTKRVYLELIAPDPAQPNPPRPRLFDLDNPDLQMRLRQGPKLIHFVSRTADMPTALAQCGYEPGAPVAMQRGELAWQLTMRPDGKPDQGVLPTVICWPDLAKHPAAVLPASGLQLMFFGVAAPKPALEVLKATGLQFVPAQNDTVMLRAELVTPKGVVVLQS